MKKFILIIAAVITLNATASGSSRSSVDDTCCGVLTAGFGGAALAGGGRVTRRALEKLLGDTRGTVEVRETVALAGGIMLAAHLYRNSPSSTVQYGYQSTETNYKSMAKYWAYETLKLAAATGTGYVVLNRISHHNALPDTLSALLSGYCGVKLFSWINNG
jgi:hypothetical protein